MQSLLRESAPPSPAARSAAIAAAMAEFGATPVSSNAPQVPASHPRVVVPLATRRPAYGRYLSIAAAVVAIGAVGAVVAGQLGGSDDESSDMTSLESSDTFAQIIPDLAREAGVDAAATTAASAADTMSASAADEMADAGIAGSEPTDDQAMELEESSVYATIAAAESPYPTSGESIKRLADRDQTLTSPGELAGLGVLLTDLRDAGELGATPETRCVFDDPLLEIVDTTRYPFADSGTTETVLVAIIDDGIEGHTAAIDPDTCIVIVVGP
ncbi:MAG TPA: hypothetical protein VMM60_07905, partial [Ilumatobacter sp.]|nr:hypothetical protein [Ilumatobacter sp.]